jgi:hypothetical protein
LACQILFFLTAHLFRGKLFFMKHNEDDATTASTSQNQKRKQKIEQALTKALGAPKKKIAPKKKVATKAKPVAAVETELVASWEPPESEIASIKQQCNIVALAVVTILPRAIYVGEWFRIQKDKCPPGEWQRWVHLHFPNVGESTIRVFMQLADNRAKLETHFGVPLALAGSDLADPKLLAGSGDENENDPPIVKFPSIREARAWLVSQSHKPSKGQKAPKPPKQKVPQNTLSPDGVDKVSQFHAEQVIPFVETFEEHERKAVWDWLGGLAYGEIKNDP